LYPYVYGVGSHDKPVNRLEMLANFSDYAADYPKLSFEEIAKLLGVDFSAAENGKVWEKECREVFDRERE
jgi:hypothetical protein